MISMVQKLRQAIQTNEQIISALEEFHMRVQEQGTMNSKKYTARTNGIILDPFCLKNPHTLQRELFFDRYLSALRGPKFDWSQQDNLKLKAEVRAGRENWDSIAQNMNRGPAACKIRYEHHVKESVNRGPWTKDEELLLVELVEKHKGVGWESVARDLGTSRTPVACLQRFQRSLNPKIASPQFSKDEDEKLAQIMTVYSSCSWGMISAEIGGNHIHEQVHRRWKAISANLKAKHWNEVEDALLKKLVKCYGHPTPWPEIAEYFEGKSDVRCRERFSDYLSPAINKGTWTSQEDQTLLELVAIHGVGKWSQIREGLPGRTDRACLARFKALGVDHAHQIRDRHLVRQQVLKRPTGSRPLERSAILLDDLVRRDLKNPQ
jgi:Myb-like DNA-binding domain